MKILAVILELQRKHAELGARMAELENKLDQTENERDSLHDQVVGLRHERNQLSFFRKISSGFQEAFIELNVIDSSSGLND